MRPRSALASRAHKDIPAGVNQARLEQTTFHDMLSKLQIPRTDDLKQGLNRESMRRPKTLQPSSGVKGLAIVRERVVAAQEKSSDCIEQGFASDGIGLENQDELKLAGSRSLGAGRQRKDVIAPAWHKGMSGSAGTAWTIRSHSMWSGIQVSNRFSDHATGDRKPFAPRVSLHASMHGASNSMEVIANTGIVPRSVCTFIIISCTAVDQGLYGARIPLQNQI